MIYPEHWSVDSRLRSMSDWHREQFLAMCDLVVHHLPGDVDYSTKDGGPLWVSFWRRNERGGRDLARVSFDSIRRHTRKGTSPERIASRLEWVEDYWRN